MPIVLIYLVIIIISLFFKSNKEGGVKEKNTKEKKKETSKKSFLVQRCKFSHLHKLAMQNGFGDLVLKVYNSNFRNQSLSLFNIIF